MKPENVISGLTENDVWDQISTQLSNDADLLEYSASIEQDKQQILLDIDIDLGGGFESGYETTTLSAPLYLLPSFKFAIHPSHFTDDIAKFFGMQDEVLGFEDFDKKFIIKTNDKRKVKELFSDVGVRDVFLSLSDFTLGITSHHHAATENEGSNLELQIEAGITDPAQLREIYHAFFGILTAINNETLP